MNGIAPSLSLSDRQYSSCVLSWASFSMATPHPEPRTMSAAAPSGQPTRRIGRRASMYSKSFPVTVARSPGSDAAMVRRSTSASL